MLALLVAELFFCYEFSTPSIPYIPEFRQGLGPTGKKEVFNYMHTSLRNVIERSFGVLKMKWRILLHLPCYKMWKQSMIIIACMALHNFIRDSALTDHCF